MRSHNRKFSSSCRGFLMIEVLVTMVILAVGLLGAAALQARSMQYAYASAQRTIATIQANDLVERLWANACKLSENPEKTAEDIEGIWRAGWENDDRFPSWEGNVEVNNSIPNIPVYDITIKWADSRIDGPGSSKQVFSYSASVPKLSCST